MPASNFVRRFQRFANRHGLLVGASAAALLLGHASMAEARSLGGGSAGSSGTAATAAAAAAAQASAQQGSAAARQAIASMARAAQALESMRAAQNSARAAALANAGTVPDGLQAGGLVVAPGAGTTAGVWTGAQLPQQSVAGGRTQVEIKQTEQKAILNWSSFNVGRDTDVYFNQTAGGTDQANWIALNRVTDPSLAPSRILGTIKAEGQVYVVNKNGIVFGGSSQVNVNSFVASSLSLSDEQFRAGINAQLVIYDDGSGNGKIAKPQFGYLGQGQPLSYLGLNAPGQVAGVAIGDAPGDVTIAAGAQITTASGGKALVFAPHVINAGRISAPDGQVILAAGEQVYLIDDKFGGVRGLEVAVSAPMRWMFDYYAMMAATRLDKFSNLNAFSGDLQNIVFPEMTARAAAVGYSVINDGMVQASHGNITLMSRQITQNGALEASTALNNRDGSIILRAFEGGMMSYASSISAGSPLRYWKTGTLILGPDSVTTAMPDLTDTSEIEQSSLSTRYSPGRIEMRGTLIDIEARASVIVPAGKISIVASTLADVGETPITGEHNLYDGSRVYIGEDAYLSVAGLQNILLTMESNVVTGEFRINELRDSPLYRDSWLRGKTVSVDKRVSGLFTDGPMADVQWVSGSPGKWVGTPLGDFSGWIGVGNTTLGELSANGRLTLPDGSVKEASITIKSSGDIITRQGSLIDVAGGSVRYQDGWITTTKLLGADGRIYDIGNAMPDQLYGGVAGSFSRTHNVQGKIDPRLTETWMTIFDRGQSRRFERGYVEGRDAGAIRMYAASAMVLDGSYWGGVINGERQIASGKLAKGGSITIGGGGDEYGRWLIGDLVVSDTPQLLPDDFSATAVLDPRWGAPPALKPPVEDPNHPGQYLPLDPDFADNWIEPVKKTYLDAEVLAQSGLSTFNLFVRNSFTLAKDDRLELAPGTTFGVIANTSGPATFAIDGSIRIAGGTVRFAGADNANYGATAVIDVSGEWRNGTLGDAPPLINGGSITIAGKFAPGLTLDVSGGGWYDLSSNKTKLKFGDAGVLSLSPHDIGQLAGLDMRGYSAASDGILTVITTGSVQVGGIAASDPAIGWIPDGLFADRGFRAFSLTTTGIITIPDGAAIAQLPASIDTRSIDVAAVASGTRLSDLGKITVLPAVDRSTHQPTSLSLAGDSVIVGEGAVLRADVGGSITLVANGHPDLAGGPQIAGDVIIRGTLDAPGGNISLSSNIGSVQLIDRGQLLARGSAVVVADKYGLRAGKILDGGVVSITAVDVKIGEDTLIDVSGSSGEIDVVADSGRWEARTLASNGGSIVIAASGATIDGQFRGFAGGKGAVGGSISISVAGNAGSPRQALQNLLGSIDPDCFGAGTGTCDMNWQDAIGFDYSMLFGGPGSMIFTMDLVNALPGGPKIIISRAAGGGSNEVDPRNFGWTDDTLDYFGMLLGSDIRPIFAGAAAMKTVNIQPRSLQGGGFADLSLTTEGAVVIDATDLAFSRSITVAAPIASVGAGTASLSAPHVVLNAQSASAGPAGTGRLVITADLIDVTNAGFNGFAETQLVARELRMGALLTNLTDNRSSTLAADGRLELMVGQLYPATGILASISAGTELVIERNGDVSLPLSVAGSLTLEAPTIRQNGVVRAPFGRIVFKASNEILLGAGSITSVSGDGLVLPYGTLSNNEFWLDPVTAPTEVEPAPKLSSLPEKSIILDAPNVRLSSGSVVDIRGGGDLYGWEHVPGPGGSRDILNQSGMFAIMPAMRNATSSLGRVWLAGGNGLAAGWYALLPARYALLPGAYAVSMVKGSEGSAPLASSAMLDGTLIVAGYRGDAFGDGRDQLSSTWRVMSGEVIRSYSEYNEAYANTYFQSEAFKLSQYRLTGIDVLTPRLPMDGGSVVFKATQDLLLDGQLQSLAAPGGRSGLVDIASAKIAILGAVQDRSDLAGYLIIDARSLSNFGAGSLLIGGMRSGDARGLKIDVTASDVVVRNDADNALSGAEILLAASDNVAINDGSVVRAQGAPQTDSLDLVMAPRIKAVYGDPGGISDGNPNNDILLSPSKDYGALVRVSVGNAVKVIRENVDTTIGGTVTVGADVVLSGSSSLMLDATRDTLVAGSASLSAAAMSLASGRIGFGGGTGGLVLDAASLSQFANTDALTLRSYSSIDFFSSVDLGNAGRGTVTLDAAAFVGHGTDAVTISGRSIALDNSGAAYAGPAGAGHARLYLRGEEIVLGSGSKTITGFDAVVLEGSARITGRGNGAIDAQQADVTLAAPLATGRGGAFQSLVTQGALHVIGSGSADADAGDSLGVRINLTGASVDLGSRIVARGGAVNLTATGGNVVVGAGGVIDVSGFRKEFFDVTEAADAGSIALTAVGSVVVSPGGQLNLAADPAGGHAGKLTLVASGGGTVVLDGRIDAAASASGKGGSFVLDIAALPDYAALSQVLNAAGFSTSRNIRVRNGDVLVDGVTNVGEFILSADQGVVTLAGLIDARAEYGGTISVFAGGNLTMLGSAHLLAGATGSYGGGRVTLETRNGQLDLQGGTIDVADAAGANGGRVRLRAPQIDTPNGVNINVAQLRTGIVGAQSAVLEGVRVGVVDAAHSFDTVRADMVTAANMFADNATAIAAGLGLPSNIVVMPGIEIDSAGDLVVSSDWNLFTDFGANARQGTLTLRAGGNLTILGHISDGFSQADRSGGLQDAESWNLRLVAGADLTSANGLALTPGAALAAGTGTLTIGAAGNGRVVRTGTGDLDVKAGRDLVLADYMSSIYTAGRADTVLLADFITPAGAIYGIDGGNLRIDVQGSASAALAPARDGNTSDPYFKDQNQLFVEWLKKTGTTDLNFVYLNGHQSSWWIDFSMFAQGVGALGGGNVAVSAGGDLTNMLVALPTTGRVSGGLTAGQAKVLHVSNGGLMDVSAGGAVRAGYYYVGGGAGEITAGEFTNGRTVSVTSSSVTTVYDIAPVIALGDAAMTVRTAGDLRLQTVLDPLMLNADSTWFAGSGDRYAAFMSGYTDRTALDLVSTGGNITLVEQGRFLSKGLVMPFGNSNEEYNYSLIGQLATNLYPSMLRVTALNGSVTSLGRLFTMPGSRPELRIVADQNVTLSETIMSRANPDMLPSVYYPVGINVADIKYYSGAFLPESDDYQSPQDNGFHEALRNEMNLMLNMTLGPLGSVIMSVRNPEHLINEGDIEPSRIFARTGTISNAFFKSRSGSRMSILISNEQTWLRAGADIRNVNYDLRNVNRTDVSMLDAGKDIIGGDIKIRGPGAILLTAGRDIYGSDFTVFSYGNYDRYSPTNRAEEFSQIKGLPDDGAATTLMAGLHGQQPAYDAFAEAYLNPANLALMPDYLKTITLTGEQVPLYYPNLIEPRGNQFILQRTGLAKFVHDMTGEWLTLNDAWIRFTTLPAVTQQRFIREAYMQELRAAGDNQVTLDIEGRPLNGGYKRGYTAIETLFPGNSWKGDIKLGNATLRTMAGGNIETLTPGGALQVAALGTVVPSGAGLVTLGYGDINIFARDSVTVNRSRILTFAGGDVTIWSTLGDIDAGRGAKTVRVPSAPEVETDQDAITTVRERADIGGSGIGTIIGFAGVEPGDVSLIAPEGTVDAGDAGIRVSGNFVVAALQVLNAENIKVEGEKKGLAKIEHTSISLNVETKDKAAEDAVKETTQNKGNERPSVIIVEVLGYGGAGAADQTIEKQGEEEQKKRNERRSDRYDPRSPVQVLGAGELTDLQTEALIYQKKQSVQ